MLAHSGHVLSAGAPVDKAKRGAGPNKGNALVSALGGKKKAGSERRGPNRPMAALKTQAAA
jgi:hypothetical protein